MFDFMSGWSLTTAIMVFSGAALVIGIAGWRLATNADTLADRTGLGEAIVGAVLLGGATSLPGIVTSAAAAYGGYANLALSNAFGGIAAQTLFLAVGDLVYRKANLEHAAASLQNVMQGTLLLTLLAIILVAIYTPSFAIWAVHPATPLLLLAYLYGLRMIHQSRAEPMWRPRQTGETREDVPAEEGKQTDLRKLWLRFAGLAATVGVAGWFLERAAVVIAKQTGISETIVGGLLTAVFTSLPELVTTVSAIRHGALTLAVGGILGGNSFDTLFAAISDGFYRAGSIYHAVTDQTIFLLALTMLLTGALLLGLVRREKHGIANIGFESVLVIALYAGAVVLLLFGP